MHEEINSKSSFLSVLHHPAATSLRQSSLACEFCRFLVRICQPSTLDRFQTDADAGRWHRIVLRSQYLRRVDRAVRTTVVWRLMLHSQTVEFESSEFAVATSHG